jgi:nitrite reductase (NADH) small subunit
MTARVRIGSAAEMPPPGQAREFAAGGRMICVANVGGTLSALDNVCVHRGGPLGQGTLEDGKVVCPWHGWQFDAATGAIGHNSEARIPVYPLILEGDDVLVEI